MALTVVCAWCGKYLGTKEGQGVEGISHGICEECKAKELASFHRMSQTGA